MPSPPSSLIEEGNCQLTSILRGIRLTSRSIVDGDQPGDDYGNKPA